MAVLNNNTLAGSSGQAAGGYQISRSLRFNSSDSGFLSRVPSSAGNRKTWTWAGWVKNANSAGTRFLFAHDDSLTWIFFQNNQLYADLNGSGNRCITASVQRDPSAWYHIVWQVDTTQAVAADRHKIYVNGALQAFSSSSYPAQNTDTGINTTTLHKIGNGFDGYLADIHFIDGQALTPSSFTEVSATTGQLIPKAYSGPTPTGNSFWLPFSDNSAATATTLGKDGFLLGNNWTPNNLQVSAFGASYTATVSASLYSGVASNVLDTNLSNNVRIATSNYGSYFWTVNFSPPIPITGPLVAYTNGEAVTAFRYTVNGTSTTNLTGTNSGIPFPLTLNVGSATTISSIDFRTFTGSNTGADLWYFTLNGAVLYANSYGSISANIDSLVDTPTSYGTDTGAGGEVRGNYATLNPLDGNPTGLSNGNLDAASANAYPTIIPGSGQWYYEVNGTGYQWDGTRSSWTARAGSHNFGQRPFAYTAPSGFKALCTTNLPAPVVAKPSTVMDVKLYTGNGSTQTISGLGFSPDLVWIKVRDNARSNFLFDTVRGVEKYIISNTTGAEVTDNTYLTTFSSTGFSVGSSADVNRDTSPIVAWCWDAGSSTVTNTQGSITSQVRANASAGFSVITYTGNNTNGATVGHGLNVAPSWIIIKNRSVAYDWIVLYTDPSKKLYLNLTNAPDSYTQTTRTSSIFTLENGTAVNGNGNSMVAYCFAPVAGYSSMGSYVGNGSADGPFVFCNFRPAVVLVKMSSSTGNWTMLDDKREGYNVDNDPLYPNLANAEGTTDLIDITSNGFKVRTTDASFNTNGGTYVYAVWASSPFAYARAR